ncbi:MAG: PcfJ domain-containing protein, partial [Lachnospiraceae bacterium]|nr:PcfJ domain-containing protein [Lachnospiraceae bacterium]
CWDRAFGRMAAGGQADYDRLMCAQDGKTLARLAELLQEGRFRRLLEDVSGKVSLWNGNYEGALNIKGNTMEEVFGIRDRQRIYRIRGMDGGEDMVEWMQYSEETGENIPQDVLVWLRENRIAPGDTGFLAGKMSLTQIRNYVERQQAESYPGKKAKNVLDQWADYLAMCKTLGRDRNDPMIYRPRELKRRHDEAVEEVRRLRLLEKAARDGELARQEAERMRQRFPGAEEVLAEIREKYEYAGKDYRILVPVSLAEIVAEGRALHHCAGASDRYFDRIVQRETYLCFLRKAEQPETPYYTIEVEPGGTIRQHRGMYDEEPEIEQIRPFLREWQKEIRKRITEQDKQYAQASAVKRQQNLEELREKRNTRVLEGLMEDFMEAV